MKLFKKQIKPLLDLTKPMPEDRTLKRYYYRKGCLAHQTEYQIIQNWNEFSALLDSWFTMEELQDNQRLLHNSRIMTLIMMCQLPVYKEKEDKVWSMAGNLWISLSPALRLHISHDEWDAFFRDLMWRVLLDDETRKLKDTFVMLINYVTKLGLPIKYLEQKIILAGIHHAVGIYLIERSFGTNPKDASKAAGDGYWDAVWYRTLTILDR